MIRGKVVIADFSFWQDDDNTPYKINFSKTWANGADGAILRAGQGSWLDEDFVDYCNNADLAKFPRGAYWFYDSRTSPVPQADLFADHVERVGFPQLGIWGDFEENYHGDFAGAIYFKTFMDRLTERFPNKLIGVYTGPDYWKTKVNSSQRDYFKKFPLWIANYKVAKPEVPSPWFDYIFWQYTSEGNGQAFGAESKECDLSFFNGTLEGYRRYFNLGDYKPASEDTGDGMKIYRVKSTATPHINLRLTPDGADIGDVLPNTEFRVDTTAQDSQGRTWLHSVQVGMIGWLADWLCDFVRDETQDCPKHTVEVFIDGVSVFRQEF